MLLVSWNEKDNPDLTPGQVKHDAEHGARMFAGQNPLIGYQELAEQADKKAMENAFGPGFVLMCRNKEVAILHDVVSTHEIWSQWHFCHKGQRLVTPTRGFAQAFLSSIECVYPFFKYNAHTISKARLPTRIRRWRKYMRGLKAQCLANDDYDQFITGDFNVKKMNIRKKIHPRAIMLAHHIYDYIIYIPGKKYPNKVTLEKVNHYKAFYTDHDVLTAQVRIS